MPTMGSCWSEVGVELSLAEAHGFSLSHALQLIQRCSERWVVNILDPSFGGVKYRLTASPAFPGQFATSFESSTVYRLLPVSEGTHHHVGAMRCKGVDVMIAYFELVVEATVLC